jgi:DNA-binding MarR family transcriptional regulator
MTQMHTEGLPLFADPPSAKVDTSREAAQDISLVVTGMRLRVLVAVVEAPNGLTCEEVEAALGMKHQTAAARLWELEGKNRRQPLPKLVEMTEQRRLNDSGSSARVYVATPKGREVYANLVAAARAIPARGSE